MSVQTFVVNYQRRRRIKKLTRTFDFAGFQAIGIEKSLAEILKSHGSTKALTNISNMCMLLALTSASLQLGVPDDAATSGTTQS